MLFISKLDGKLSCSEHDPCGPDPLEPGEIREYVPSMTSMRPGAVGVPVAPAHISNSRRATSSSSSSSASSVSSPSGQAAASRPEPPPRLYINTKTATSSFVPSSRSYDPDTADGKTFSSPPASSKDEREEGEVEDGEVCGLHMEEVEDDDDDDDEADEEEDENENEMEEMEIVEDEEDEPLYGGDLLGEDDDEEEDEGGDVYDTWGDYVDDDADDGEVEGEDLEEWGRVEDDDK